MNKKNIGLVIVIICIAGYFRFTGINWDQGHHLHPDERFIVMTIENIRWPDNLNPHFFAYGSFPLYLLKLIGYFGGFVDPAFASYDKINLLGRAVSAIFDIGTMIMVMFTIKILTKDKKTMLLGGLWYACSVLPIQLSHFYAVDTMLTFFIISTLYLLIKYHLYPSRITAITIGICFGLALATKISAIMLVVPIAITALLGIRSRIKDCIAEILMTITAALIMFFICQPFAFLDFVTFSRQIMEQQAMTKNAFVFPYTLQYVGKIPYWYEIKNVFLWGQGPILACFSILGVLYITFKAIWKKHAMTVILMSFFWLYFVTVGRFAIGFMRYMLPLYPISTIGAAIVFEKFTRGQKRNIYFLSAIISTVAIVFWALSFQAIYQAPNTRSQVTDWIVSTIPQGSTIALEHWDDGLPLRNSSDYSLVELPFYDEDTKDKWEQINTKLDKTDYIVIASNRLYVPLMKMTNCNQLPKDKCYRTTAAYYERLFDGSLGFTKVAEFSSYPTIPLLHIPIDDISSDESFTVYDHPKIMIFQKTAPYRPVLLEE